MCVPFFSLCHLSVTERGSTDNEGQGGGLCDKCFGGVGVEVRIKGTCANVLLRWRTVDEAPLVLSAFQRGETRRDSGWGPGTSLLAGRKDPGALRTGCGQAYRGVRSPRGLLKLTISHCHRWRDRYESLIENFFLTPYPDCTA